MNMVRLRKYLMSQWPIVVLYGGLFAVLGAALYWQLNSLLPGYSQPELAAYQASLSLRGLLDNPLNAPFLLAVRALTYLHPDSLLVTRLVATLCGLLALIVFAILLRRWHDTRTSVLGTLLFGLSAWFLHTARLGTPEVLMFGIFLLVAAGFWLKRTNHWLALLMCFLMVAGLLYVPGMVWFIVLGTLWQWKAIDRAFKKHLVLVSLGSLVLIAALVPLGWAIYKNHELIMPLLGLPQQWPAPLVMAENLLKVPFHLFIHNGSNPVAWLGTAPILDVFSLSMFVLGGYLYLRHLRLMRTPLFISMLVLMAVLIAVGGAVTFTVIMPFIYLVVAAGISYLVSQWFNVFPRNPIARTIGWAAICVVVGVAVAYQLGHYFIAWPQAAATHEVFTVQKP